MQKKHLQIEQEFYAHQPLLLNSLKVTRQLIERKHYAHSQLTLKLNDLEEKWENFKELMENRGRMLVDAFETQKFYSEAEDLLKWLKEKQPIYRLWKG